MAVLDTVGLRPVSAPAPAPRHDDLLAVVPPIDLPADQGWLSGVWSEGYPAGPARTFDPCANGTSRVKDAGGPAATQRSGQFVAYLPTLCTASSVGAEPGPWLERLRVAFRVYERMAVERALATGEGLPIGSYLGDANMEQLAAGPVSPAAAMRLLERAVAAHGSGIIHAAPSTVAAWDSLNLTVEQGGLTFSKRSTPIAVGPGYADAVPAGADPLDEGQQWAFVSGPLEIQREPEISIPASDYPDMLLRSLNDVEVFAERAYVFNWIARQASDDDTHTQAGVLVNENAATGGGSANLVHEVPSGIVDGLNDTFTLSAVPTVPPGLLLWKNGLLMLGGGDDYTLVGVTITFVPSQVPQIGDLLQAVYLGP